METKIKWALTVLLLYITRLARCYWWSIGNIEEDFSPEQLMTHRFTRGQRLMIEKNPKLLDVIRKGALIAIKQCQKQFRNERWNCTNYSSQSVFGRILDIACRETSFIYAITSAGVSYSLTDSCAKGKIKGCYCNSGKGKKIRYGNTWVFEGCHDNIEYGYINGRRFTGARERSNDFRSAINRHNNEAGRKAIEQSQRTLCKCHGVSGNCNLKTCRKTLPNFGQIGDRLKEHYNTATKVESVQISGNSPPQNKFVQIEQKTRVTRNSGISYFSAPTSENLIYFEDSPNFCKENLDNGSLGIQGRYCNASLHAKGVDGCEILCCGGKWKTENLTRDENCFCKFKWCCEVNCKTCSVTREYSYCT